MQLLEGLFILFDLEIKNSFRNVFHIAVPFNRFQNKNRMHNNCNNYLSLKSLLQQNKVYFILPDPISENAFYHVRPRKSNLRRNLQQSSGNKFISRKRKVLWKKDLGNYRVS